MTEELPLYMQLPQEDTALRRVDAAYDSLERIPSHVLSDVMVLSLSIVNIVLATLRDRESPTMKFTIRITCPTRIS